MDLTWTLKDMRGEFRSQPSGAESNSAVALLGSILIKFKRFTQSTRWSGRARSAIRPKLLATQGRTIKPKIAMQNANKCSRHSVDRCVHPPSGLCVHEATIRSLIISRIIRRGFAQPAD